MVTLAGINHIAWQWCLAQGEERTLELIVLAILIIEEAERTATAGGVVDYLGNHLVYIVEEQLVADTDLAGWLYQYIPEAHLRIELTEQEYLNLGICLLLGSVETGWEHLGIVEDEGISLLEIVHDVLELQEYRIAIGILDFLAFLIGLIHLDGFRLLVDDHQSSLVAASNLEYTFTTSCLNHTFCLMWVKCHLRSWQLEVELR